MILSSGLMFNFSRSILSINGIPEIHVRKCGDEYNVESLNSDFSNKTFHEKDAERQMVAYLEGYLEKLEKKKLT